MITAINLRNKESKETLDLYNRIQVREPLIISKETSYEVESSTSYAVRRKSKFKPRKISLLTQFRSNDDRDVTTLFVNTHDIYELDIIQDGVVWTTEVIVENNDVTKIQVDSYEVYSLNLIQLMDFRSLSKEPLFSITQSTTNTPEKYTYNYAYTYGTSPNQNAKVIKNTSVKASPAYIVINGYSLNPQWELRKLDGTLVLDGGINGIVPSGSQMIVDSWYSNPQILLNNESRRDMQDFNKFTFFTIPKGEFIFTIKNATDAQMYTYNERELF